MSAARIVKAINIFEDSDLNNTARMPGVPPDWLCFDVFEEGFHGGIIIAIAPASHGDLEAVPVQQL